eukprot:7291928-Prymnesium_polylepis.1
MDQSSPGTGSIARGGSSHPPAGSIQGCGLLKRKLQYSCRARGAARTCGRGNGRTSQMGGSCYSMEMRHDVT